MRLFRPLFIADWLFPDAIFRLRTTEKLLYLTFDDGPDPDSTPQLLDILDRYNIKAVFFCTGRSAEKYPGLINQITKRGHLTGNHGYDHLNGWRTSFDEYSTDIANAAPFTSSLLFRPPYGRIRFDQYKKLKEKYQIVFWDLMPYDFDTTFGKANSLKILKNKIRPGSIIVLHDTSHSVANEILEQFLTYSLNEGYQFDLPDFTTLVHHL